MVKEIIRTGAEFQGRGYYFIIAASQIRNRLGVSAKNPRPFPYHLHATYLDVTGSKIPSILCNILQYVACKWYWIGRGLFANMVDLR